MHVDAHLDINVVPLDQDDTVTVLVEIKAPDPDPAADRPPATLEVVLDRSGSMAGGRLAGAQRALLALVDRLAPADNFGLVSFDQNARVEVAAAPLTNKDDVRRRIAALVPGGTTDVSSGLLRGIQEARRASADKGATLLLISDGHANVGIVDHGRLGAIARSGREHGVTTTTLGYGLGYDEELMIAIAEGGAGNALHAEDPDTAGQLIAAEIDGLLAKVAQAASLTIRPRPPVESVFVYGGLPGTRLPDGSIMVELGDFYAGETRKVLLRFAVPGMSTLGVATIAELAFTHVESASLTGYTHTVPVAVNVVPGDEAAGRVPDPVVRAERLFQEAQDAKRQAAEALRRGDLATAQRLLNSAGDALEAGLSWAPDAQAAELATEARNLRRYAAEAAADQNRVSKQVTADWYGQSRKRGRYQVTDGDDDRDQK
jgi:Uncharacterized protein containing a von Willebrand factor type A (vWA) domain